MLKNYFQLESLQIESVIYRKQVITTNTNHSVWMCRESRVPWPPREWSDAAAIKINQKKY